jgi:integrase
MARRDPRLMKRGGRYYVRVKVPPELRPVLGRWEYTYSLRTSDLGEARRRVRQESVKIDAELARARRHLEAKPIRALSASEVEYLALSWFHRGAATRLRPSSSPHCPEMTHEEVEADARQWLEALTDPDNLDCQQTVGRAIADLLAREGIELDTRSESYRHLHELIRRAALEQARRDLKAIQQDYTVRPGDALFSGLDGTAPPVQRVAPITVRELTNQYRNDPSRSRLSPKSRLKDTARFRLFEEVIGAEKPVSRITRADAAALLDLLSTLPPNATKRFPRMSAKDAAATAMAMGLPPMSPTSAKSYFTAFGSLMRFAVDRGYRDDNPAERLKVRTETLPARHRRNPFSADQLRAIFGAPLYTGCENDEVGWARPGPNVIRRGRFWVPLVALFTGMRLNEVCQLELADITTIDGADIILVRGDDDDAKRVKTEAGNRYVPVHPELRRIGLLRYRTEMIERGERLLFPELAVGSTGYRSDVFSKWFARFLESVGAKTARTSFHSFRHSYRDALREADISAERVRALGGWSSNRTEEIYGSGLRPATLAREIRKVRYEGLDLSHLYGAYTAVARV